MCTLDSLNVGNDLLMGSGLSRYVALRKIVSAAQDRSGTAYDFVLIDLPPSFGALVRAAFYSSDYYVVSCTSDNFSVYCVSLIGQMVPTFVSDWGIGLTRFKATNPHFTEFDGLGKPVFAGWIFNGFDTARRRRTAAQIQEGVEFSQKEMIQADKTMHEHVAKAIREDLVDKLRANIKSYEPVAMNCPVDYRVGDFEDANVLIQNSLWLSVPLGELENHNQVVDLRDRSKWAQNQIEQINLFRRKFGQSADYLSNLCV